MPKQIYKVTNNQFGSVDFDKTDGAIFSSLNDAVAHARPGQRIINSSGLFLNYHKYNTEQKVEWLCI